MTDTEKRLHPQPKVMFLRRPLTQLVTAIRLALIVLPYLGILAFPQWLYSPSLLSVLVRPHQRLSYLQEALAIRALSNNGAANNFAKAYLANGTTRIPPLLLAALSPLLERSSHPELWLSLLLLLIDIGIAYLLEKIGNCLLLHSTARIQQQQQEEDQRQRELPEVIQPEHARIFPIYASDKESNSLISLSSLPLWAAQLYFCSPFTILPSCLYHSWQSLPSFFFLASIFLACSSSFILSTFFLAVAAYLEPFYVVYSVPAIVLLHYGGNKQSTATISIRSAACIFLGLFCLWTACLQYLTYALVGSDMYWSVLGDIYGETWLTTSPNLSLQWYFRMQLFARFQDYFGAIFLGLPFVLIAPLTVRLWKYPSVLMACFSFIWCIYRPVQVLQDANLALSLMLINPRSMARMGVPSFVALCSIMVPVLLNIVDHWMWLEGNNGNANYMFFQCLAYNVFLGTILGQLTSATAQRDKALRINLQEEAKAGTHEKVE